MEETLNHQDFFNDEINNAQTIKRLVALLKPNLENADVLLTDYLSTCCDDVWPNKSLKTALSTMSVEEIKNPTLLEGVLDGLMITKDLMLESPDFFYAISQNHGQWDVSYMIKDPIERESQANRTHLINRDSHADWSLLPVRSNVNTLTQALAAATQIISNEVILQNNPEQIFYLRDSGDALYKVLPKTDPDYLHLNKIDSDTVRQIPKANALRDMFPIISFAAPANEQHFVTLEGSDVNYPCLLGKNTWNGWEQPSFAADVALDVMKSADTSFTGDPSDWIFYVVDESSTVAMLLKDWLADPKNKALGETNAVLMVDPIYGMEDAEVYNPVKIDGKPHWSIGGGSWCWEKNNSEKSNEIEQVAIFPSINTL